MKDQNQSMAGCLTGNSGVYSTDYTKLLGLIKSLIALRNETENAGLDKDFMDGLCSHDLLVITDKLDEILYNDFARPLSLCVVEAMAFNMAAV